MQPPFFYALCHTPIPALGEGAALGGLLVFTDSLEDSAGELIVKLYDRIQYDRMSV
jgi:hypothetical protein